jgi:hypothetical protein
MRKRFTIIWAFLLVAVPALSQENLLQRMECVWLSTNPPGIHIAIYPFGAGSYRVSLPFGQGEILTLDGRGGSNIKIAGEGFECFYFVPFPETKTMTWMFKSGTNTSCQNNYVFTRLYKLAAQAADDEGNLPAAAGTVHSP